MSSRSGYHGGASRCFPVTEWQGFMECYSAFRTKDTSTCVPHLEDYMECLHHTKERAYAQRIATQISNGKKGLLDDKEINVEELGFVKA